MARYHPLDALFDLQRALDASLESDWLRSGTAGAGAFPPINVFQQGDTLIAILEVAGVSKEDLDIQAKDNTIPDLGPDLGQERDRLSGKCQRASARAADRNI